MIYHRLQMCLIAPEISGTHVLDAFQSDAPYLFLGAAFFAVAVIAAAFAAVGRKRDRLLIYFALFGALYGLRLWIQSSVLRMAMADSAFFARLSTVIDYVIPVPAVLFFDAAGLLDRLGRIAAYILAIVSIGLTVAVLIVGPSRTANVVNNVVVILALTALVVQFAFSVRRNPELQAIGKGLFVFVAFALWDNVAGALNLPWRKVEPFGFVAFLGALGYVAARRTLQRDQKLNELQKELQIARRIQLAILPAGFPASTSFQVAARYVPMTSVAGDFYDFIVAGDTQAGLLIADVSGHGVPAALIASMVKLAATSQRKNAGTPSALLGGMNAALCGNTQNQFVTAAYVHLDSESRELRYSAAGHPAMLLLRRGQVQSIEENGLMLAAFDFATYSDVTHRLEPGDRLLLYTDGIIEAANSKGDFFGHDALCALLSQTSDVPASGAADRIMASVQKWSASQDDDLTVLVCDYTNNA